MESVKYILQQPDYIEGVGYIYPVKVKDYDTFMQVHTVLYINKNHFEVKEEFKDKLQILDLIMISDFEGKEDIIKNFETLFSLTLKKDVYFMSNENNYGFIIDEGHRIDRINYDQVRTIIMKQNLIFEQKVYKDPLVQEWAMRTIEARRKNSIKVTIEDMITTVSKTGKSYETIGEQSIYQLYADFKRYSKDKEYDTSITLKAAGAEKVSVNHFAEFINMFEDPYSDLFVKKDKLSKLDSALGK